MLVAMGCFASSLVGLRDGYNKRVAEEKAQLMFKEDNRVKGITR